MNLPCALFVYGTLKRGQVREGCWPCKPLAVETAIVRGVLFDLGEYPAMVGGEDLVAGELWRFAEEDMGATLAALDVVEGCEGKDDDEYRRVVMECETSGGIVAAWTYTYARAECLRVEQRIKPGRDGMCRWK